MSPCKICNHAVRNVFDGQFKINYYFCPHCEFLFLDEAHVLPAEREKAEYLTHNNTLENKGYVDMFLNLVRKAVSPFQSSMAQGVSLSALDFGSGPGDCVLAHVLKKEFGYRVDPYDIYFSPAKIYEGKQYHLITCTEVIEHLKKPLEILKILKNHLKPGGILLITTLFHPIKGFLPGGELEGEEVFQKWWYRRDVTHICFFRPKTFQYLAAMLGMDILFCTQPNTITLTLNK